MSHQERVRRNYHCGVCGGEGTLDEGERCYECSGSGVILEVRPPRPRPTPLTPGMRAIVNAGLEQLKANCRVAEHVSKQVKKEYQNE